MSAASTEPARAARHDGEASRARLLHSGLRLFAQQGFSKTSTRELAEAAGVNIASISYYFGDKAGLYRAVFFEPSGSAHDDIARYYGPEMSLAQALGGLYAGFLEPLKQGDTARLCMKLHFREMLEPTGLWQEEITHGIKPMHDALLAVLCRHFALAQADDELQRLAVCIAGLGVHMHVGHDVIQQLAPQLNDGADALDRWCERLVMYALAMIHAEQQRRGAEAAPGASA
ncbi:MAG TPA: CerR family C-terminal domain-containing protein [Rubrivivax sp.]|nr:CerR family C-terminal domain-containing protein [Rubrivivax sp.]